MNKFNRIEKKQLAESVISSENASDKEKELAKELLGAVEHIKRLRLRPYRSDVKTEELEQQIEDAKTVAFNYGQVDGDWHLRWVITDMVRKMCGTEEKFQEWLDKYNEPEDFFDWDEGTAP